MQKMMRATEQAARILIEAQQNYEERCLREQEEAPLLFLFPDGKDEDSNST